MNIKSLFLLALTTLLANYNVKSATYYSRVSSGNWGTNATWSTVACGGAAATSIPGAGDNVIICTGNIVVVNINPASCLSLTLNGRLSYGTTNTLNVGTGGITINSTGDVIGTGAGFLNTSGGLTINKTLTSNNVTIGFQTTSGQVIAGVGSVAKLAVNANTTNNASLTIRTSLLGSATLTQGTGASIAFAGTAAIACSLDASVNSNTFNYSGTSTQTIKSANYYHLIISGAGTSTLGGDITVNGDLSVTGGTLASSVYQITGNATGTFSMANSTILSLGTTSSIANVDFPTNFIEANISLGSTSTVQYNGNYVQAISPEPAAYGNLTITNGTAAVSKFISSSKDVMVAGNLTLTKGSGTLTLDMGLQNLIVTGNIAGTGGIIMGGGNITISGNFSNTGTFSAGSGNVTYNGITQNVKGTTYNDLIISGSGTKTLLANTTINGDLNISAGTLATGIRQITGNVSGILSMASGTALTVGLSSNATNVNFPTNFVKANILLSANSSISYIGNTTQTISSIPDYQNLLLATSANKTANGNLTVLGDLTTTTTKLNMNTYTLNLSGDYLGASGGLVFTTGQLNIGGDYANNGTFTCGTGTVNYNANVAQSIRGGIVYYNLTTSNNSTKTISNDITVNNNLSINSTSSLDASASNFTITIKKNWVNNGTFIPQLGTVIFNGTTAQTINGSGLTTFSSLTINNTSGVAITGGSYSLSDVLTLSNGVFNTGGNTFTMLSSSSKTARIATVSGTGAVTGQFIIQKYLGSRSSLSWANLSSPVISTTFADWDNELFFYYPHGGGIVSNVLKYNESIADYVGVSSATTILTGEGVEVFFADDFTLSSFTSTVLTSVGTPYIGTKNINLSYTPAVSPYEGQNLIGNPFASSIQVNGMTFTNALSTVDVYDNITDNYITLSGTDELAAHQGFWAYATAPGASVSIPESAKTTSLTGTIKSLENKPFFTLTLSSVDVTSKMSHTLKIACDEEALDGWDFKDHPFRKSPKKEAPYIIANSEHFPLSISTFNSNHSTYSMPLKTKVGIKGKYKINTQNIETIYPYFEIVVLEDKFLGKKVDLNVNENYVFDADTSDLENRFILHFQGGIQEQKNDIINLQPKEDIAQIYTSSNGAMIEFSTKENIYVQINVVNLMGQNIIAPNAVQISNQQKLEIELPQDFKGIYFVRLNSKDGEVVKKMVK